MRRCHGAPFLLLVSLGACGDDGGGGGSSRGTASSSGAATTDATAASETRSPGDESSESGSSESGFDPPVPVCGNGFLERGEDCDDGNAIDDDGCQADCRIRCGLDLSTTVLPPTAASEILGLSVGIASAGEWVVAGSLREIVIDQGGGKTLGPRETLVAAFDLAGAPRWQQRLLGPLGADAETPTVAVTETGDAIVVATVDEPRSGSRITAWRLAAADGSVVWSVDYDVPLETDIAFGVAVGPDGDPVVSGQVRAGEGDDDVLAWKLDATSGDTQWASTWSGPPAPNGFSTDDGGPVAIAPSGDVFVLAGRYIDFDAFPAELLRFDGASGELVDALTVDLGPGGQVAVPRAVSVDSDGNPYLAIERTSGGVVQFFVLALDESLELRWSRSHDEFETGGSSWIVAGVQPTALGEVVVAGRYINDETIPDAQWQEAWVTRLDGDGQVVCAATEAGPDASVVPASLAPTALATDRAGNAVLAGAQLDGADQVLWVGRFRPD